MSSASPAVEIDGLVMAYGDKVAVDGLSLEMARGSITAVLGPNGAGKTTTLETCEGYRVPQRGTVVPLRLDLAGGYVRVHMRTSRFSRPLRHLRPPAPFSTP